MGDKFHYSEICVVKANAKWGHMGGSLKENRGIRLIKSGVVKYVIMSSV